MNGFNKRYVKLCFLFILYTEFFHLNALADPLCFIITINYVDEITKQIDP